MFFLDGAECISHWFNIPDFVSFLRVFISCRGFYRRQNGEYLVIS